MAAKQLSFDQEAREKIRAGVTKLARAVKVTYGPRGRNAVIEPPRIGAEYRAGGWQGKRTRSKRS